MTAAPIFPWSDGTSATVRMVLGTGIGTIRMHGPTGSARTATLTMRTDGGRSDAGGSVTVVAMMTTSTGGDMSAEMTATSGTANDLTVAATTTTVATGMADSSASLSTLGVGKCTSSNGTYRPMSLSR